MLKRWSGKWRANPMNRERSHFILDIDAINKAIKYSHEVENMQEETKNNPYALIVCTDQKLF